MTSVKSKILDSAANRVAITIISSDPEPQVGQQWELTFSIFIYYYQIFVLPFYNQTTQDNNLQKVKYNVK